MPEQLYDGRGNPISGNTFIAGVTEDNYLMTIGSITSMPAISVATGSEMWIKAGSVQTYNPVGIGSVLVVSSAGSVGMFGSVAITNASIQVDVTVADYVSVVASGVGLAVSGTVNLASSAGSVGIFGSVYATGSITTIGSVQPYNPIGIGSSLVISSAGSIGMYGSIYTTGSIEIITNPVPVSGIVRTETLSSAGSIGIFGSIYSTGSIRISSDPVSIAGSVRLTGQDANIQVYNSGNFAIVGSLNSIPAWTGIGSALLVSTAGSINVMGSLYTTGSVVVTNMITSEEKSVGKGEVAGVPGSITYAGGNYNGSLFPFRLDLGSYLMIAGSISNMTATGSEMWVKGGSVQTYSPVGVGSVLVISSAGSIGIFGSAFITGSIVQIGSIQTYGIGSSLLVSTAGSHPVMGSLYVTGSIEILTNSVKVAGSVYATGSVNIVGGSVALYGIGSMLLTSTAGSIGIFGSAYTTGSINIATSPVPVSGPVVAADLGSAFYLIGSNIIYGSVYQTGSINIATTPVPVSGTATIAGSAYVTGSINIVGGSIALYGIGSSLIVSSAGSINVMGSVYTTGSINIVGGSIALYGVGSQLLVSSAGSINVVQTAANAPWQTEQQRGTFGFSGAILIASGTSSNIITPGAGSKILLKGFTASTNEGIQFRLLFSGGTQLGTWLIPPSGAMGLNMIGMEPSGGTNQPIAAGLFNAGSLYLTVFTRDTL